MNSEKIEEQQKCKKSVQILVNEKFVHMPDHKASGLEIKQSAIEQGVSIELDFILSELIGASGKTRIIGDEDLVKLNKNSEFVGIAHDDNSDAPNIVVPEVLTAISEIQATFPEALVTYKADGSGGVYITVEPVALGGKYHETDTWVGCHITFQYPFSDVYPIFIRPDLKRKDEKALGEGIGHATFDGKPATQLSRRSNRRNPKLETAAMKLLKVLKWLRERT